MAAGSAEHTYLTVPADKEMRPCVGLVLAGMAARAHIGVGNLEDAVELLESYHSSETTTRFRFCLDEDGIVAQVEEAETSGEDNWHTVVEMVS